MRTRHDFTERGGSPTPDRLRSPGTPFLLLVIAQAAHSVEECVYRLYDVFAPANYVASVVSGDPATGFALANIGIVLVGLWCWAAGVRKGRAWGVPAAWVWAVVETANGIGHLGMAAWRGRYFPGVATAPLLLATALYLMRRLSMPSTVSGVSTPPAP